MRILLVDDERSIRLTLGDALEDAGHRVTRCENLAQAREALDQGALDCLVTDLRLPDGSGLELLPLAQARNPASGLLVITAHQTIETAVQATKSGADYLVKPFLNEEVLARLAKIGEVQKLKAELAELKTQVSGRFKIDRIIGKTAKMRELFKTIETIGPSDATVLITGESGTGKELAAQALHRNSPRSSRPLIKVSCAALPESLLEDELFGHERGAFTDAKERKAGRFELADGGSIFLDDIDDMPLQTQVKLLRVLQEREFERIGGTKTIKVDVRVITACKTNLGGLVQEGRFRDDLYYRLRVVVLHLLPLRERLEDVPLLLQYFIQLHGAGRSYRVPPEAVLRMCQYEWPGNVRELENAVLRAIAMAGPADLLDERHLLLAPTGLRAGAAGAPLAAAPQSVSSAPPPPQSQTVGSAAPAPVQAESANAPQIRPLRKVVADAEREYIKRVLETTGGNRTRAAELLDISRKNLWEKMRDLGLL